MYKNQHFSLFPGPKKDPKMTCCSVSLWNTLPEVWVALWFIACVLLDKGDRVLLNWVGTKKLTAVLTLENTLGCDEEECFWKSAFSV